MNLITPFTIGLIGSMHCIGMCGPIAIALPIRNKTGFKRALGIGLYNFGRVTTYALIGALFGILGKSFYLAGIQRQVSVILGLLILLSLLLPYSFSQKNKVLAWWNKTFRNFYNEIAVLLKNSSFISLFMIGIINGFLPCGLVYLALAGALAQTEIIDGSLFMIFFGLGTVPAMYSIAWVSKYITLKTRNRIRKASPILIGFFALLLIFRGLNLGVFLSPRIDAVGAFIQSCL
jgi:sulfite exporter TauE/SafE